MSIGEWRSQIKRGTLEFCVLLMIAQGECYGYELIARLEKRPILSARESTIYPLLRRLLKDGLLTSTWRDSAEGLPSRKYYTITDAGRNYLAAMEAEWGNLLSAIEEIREE
ncbi:MAG: PadR family transcriptional regulator [Oscillospiraceae bacterium]|nr:PadR family transcriptional regulator [Oscillospiraceae bacterium]